jgi:hypothetical protein
MALEYSLSLISLLKGIVFNHQRETWDNLLQYEPDVKKYFSAVGLDVYIDKSEGYAYLSQKQWEDESTALPRLAERRQLNFHTSLLCIVLRKYLLEQDAQGGSVRCIISEEELISRASVFLPSATDEAKQHDKLLSSLNKVVEIGFLRRLKAEENNYEINRIIKGFIDATVIDDTLARLQQYARERDEAG